MEAREKMRTQFRSDMAALSVDMFCIVTLSSRCLGVVSMHMLVAQPPLVAHPI